MQYLLQITAHNEDPELGGSTWQTFSDKVPYSFILLVMNEFIYRHIIIKGTIIKHASIKEFDNDHIFSDKELSGDS